MKGSNDVISTSDIQSIIGADVYGSDQKIGTVGQVYLDDKTEQPEFITVKTGLFGGSESFVPVADATTTGDGVTVPFDKEKVKNAPNVDTDGHISESQEQEIFAYYGLAYEKGWQAGDERLDHSQEPGVVGHDTSGPTTDSAMTRSEEHLQVGTQQQEAGRVRLRKWVETETQTTTVPVTKERAVVEREPITDANVDDALDGPAISEEEHEVVLNEERAVVDKTVAPVERVRVAKESVTEQQAVSGEVRKERIEVEGDGDVR